MTRYIALQVFRSALGDSTNHGASSKFKTIYVEHEDGIEMDSVKPEECFRIKETVPGHQVVVPVVTPDGVLGPMFGGNLASSLYGTLGDKIFRIHDRFETPEEYRALST